MRYLIDGEITIVYGFGENQAYVWLFRVKNDVSYLCNYFYRFPDFICDKIREGKKHWSDNLCIWSSVPGD